MYQPGKLDKPDLYYLADKIKPAVEKLDQATRLNKGAGASPETQKDYDEATFEWSLAMYAYLIFDDDDLAVSKEREQMRENALAEVTEMRRKATELTQRGDEASITLGLVIHANINEYEALYVRFLECQALAVSSSDDQIISDMTRTLATKYAAGAFLATENILAKNEYLYGEAGE